MTYSLRVQPQRCIEVITNHDDTELIYHIKETVTQRGKGLAAMVRGQDGGQFLLLFPLPLVFWSAYCHLYEADREL